ncbi:MAG: DUF4156 domain-containing protein [Gammaproteobacteria bacterium]|nr:DUF4156 domain-containing protein [Gammaproteobacteria bacterium]
MKLVSTLLVTAMITGCSWVKVAPEARDIPLKTMAEVGQCKYLGTATGKTKAKVTVISRNDKKVAKEVLDLARNEALSMSGNTLVAKGDLVDGRQTFAVYRCLQ